MKAKIFLILPLILLSYFFLVPHTSNNTYAALKKEGETCMVSNSNKNDTTGKVQKGQACQTADELTKAGKGKNIDTSKMCILGLDCDKKTHKCTEALDTPSDPNKAKGKVCQIVAQTKVGQGNCPAEMICKPINNDSCFNDPTKGVKMCTGTCEPKNEGEGKTCQSDGSPSAQGGCAGGMICKPTDTNACITDPKTKKKLCTGKCQPNTAPNQPAPNQPNLPTANDNIQCEPGLDCDSGTHKCVKKPVIDNSKNPTLAPPPSPPCAEGEWQDGKCAAMITAFGKIETNPEKFIQRLFAVLLSVSGGIALFLIIKAGYQLMTSQGTPEKMQQAREQLIAAIVGLLFMIFSFVLLQAIGFDILKLPKSTIDVQKNGGNAAGTNAGAAKGDKPQDLVPTAKKTAETKGSACFVNGSGQSSCPSGFTCQVKNQKTDCAAGSCAGTCQ
jgi:hypothetical protein